MTLDKWSDDYCNGKEVAGNGPSNQVDFLQFNSKDAIYSTSMDDKFRSFSISGDKFE
jgi:hypothetical protein